MFRDHYKYYKLKYAFTSGMAPGWVQTKALTSTASLWASATLLPSRIEAQNEPVNESPAPTVSVTSTTGSSGTRRVPG